MSCNRQNLVRRGHIQLRMAGIAGKGLQLGFHHLVRRHALCMTAAWSICTSHIIAIDPDCGSCTFSPILRREYLAYIVGAWPDDLGKHWRRVRRCTMRAEWTCDSCAMGFPHILHPTIRVCENKRNKHQKHDTDDQKLVFIHGQHLVNRL